MALIDRIVGHQEIKKRVGEQLSRFPQSTIFSGIRGVGKFQMALAVAQKLVCKDNGCGVCGSCVRIEKQQSESLYVLRPETTSTPIKVEEIRKLLQFLSLAGQEKVVVIDEAHLMNAQASNSLLKTLEEPPENTYLILVTASPYLLLTTIRSRCQVFRFGRLNDEELAQLFPESQRAHRAACQGSAGRMHEVIEEGWLEKRNLSLQFLKTSLSGEKLPLKPISESKESSGECIAFLKEFYRDWYLIQAGDQRTLHVDIAQELAALPLDPSRARKHLETLTNYEGYIAMNMERQLIFENLRTELRG